jgi:hypothetical protein
MQKITVDAGFARRFATRPVGRLSKGQSSFMCSSCSSAHRRAWTDRPDTRVDPKTIRNDLGNNSPKSGEKVPTNPRADEPAEATFHYLSDTTAVLGGGLDVRSECEQDFSDAELLAPRAGCASPSGGLGRLYSRLRNGPFRLRKVEPLTDMPPIVAQIEPEPGLIPAVVTVLPGRILALRPTENATEEERRIIGRIALAQFLKVLPERREAKSQFCDFA